MNTIKELALKYPNDADLGAKIRELQDELVVDNYYHKLRVLDIVHWAEDKFCGDNRKIINAIVTGGKALLERKIPIKP
jgi:hypothetical protein